MHDALAMFLLAPPVIGAIIAAPVNFSTRRVGGLRFIKLGRFCVSFCVSREYKSL